MEEVVIKDMEFKQKLVGLVNESELPAFILKPIFKDIFEQLNLLEHKQYQQVKEKEAKEND